MTELVAPRVPRIYSPSPEETTQLNLNWQVGVSVVALSGIAMIAAVYTGNSSPLVSRAVTYVVGGVISLLSLTALYLLRSLDSFINKNGDRYLHAAVQSDNTKRVEWLLFFGANVNAQNSKNKTALHLACDSPDWGCVQQSIMRSLIEYGADVNACTHLNETPLHCVIVNFQATIARILQISGKNTEPLSQFLQNEALGVRKVRILRNYGAKNDVERDPSLDLLVPPKAALGYLDDKKGRTPLGLATEISDEIPESNTLQKAFWSGICDALLH